LPESQRTYALTILGAVAVSEEGLTREQLMARLHVLESDPAIRAMHLDEVLLVLEEDGYLAVSEERIQFTSFLLKAYWRRNHAR
jgi:archaeosine-15-forming tRNA-guanine transglycosylase